MMNAEVIWRSYNFTHRPFEQTCFAPPQSPVGRPSTTRILMRTGKRWLPIPIPVHVDPRAFEQVYGVCGRPDPDSKRKCSPTST